MRRAEGRNSRSGSAAAGVPPAGQGAPQRWLGPGPAGPGELVHVGCDAVDDCGHPREVDGHDGSVWPVGGRAQVDRWRRDQRPGARASLRTAAASSPHRIAGRRCYPGRRVRCPPRIGILGGWPACRPQLAERRVQRVQVGGGHELVHPEGDSPIAVARVRIEIPSTRAETSAHVRSRSACSSRHAARETRVKTRRSRRAVSIRSLIVTRPSCQQRSGNWTL